MKKERKIRVQFIVSEVLTEMNVKPEQLGIWSRDDDIRFAKCLITLLLDEEGFNMKVIADCFGMGWRSAYHRLIKAKKLLAKHPVFKTKYLKLIEIITANED